MGCAGFLALAWQHALWVVPAGGSQTASERLLRREDLPGRGEIHRADFEQRPSLTIMSQDLPGMTVDRPVGMHHFSMRKESVHAQSEKSMGSKLAAEELIGASSELVSWLEYAALRLVEPSHRRLNITLARGEQTNVTNAVVTHICNDRWAPGALALAASLKHTGTKADRVLMLSGNVSSTYFSLLSSYFDRVYIEEPIKEHPSIKRSGADCLTLQLRAWQLPYKKALYMDADMVVLRNPDWLFDTYGEISARMDHWGFGWNGGMFMCEPSQKTFTKLRTALKTYNAKARLHGMQQFLNYMFPRCNLSRPLSPESAGCMRKPFPGSHNLFSRDLRPGQAAALIAGDFSRFESLHFSGDWDTQKKPWMRGCMVGADSTTRYSGDTRMNILNLWMNSYRHVKPENSSAAAQALLRIDCPMYDCVTRRGTMDFIVHLTSVDCWADIMIRRLLQFASPRRIITIAEKTICDKVKATKWPVPGIKVECRDQDTLIPKVSFADIQTWVSKRFLGKVLKTNQTKNQTGKVVDAAKVMFKQFLRMGIVEATDKLRLSENYVVWDSDMVLIRDFCPFNNQGQTNFMEGILGPDNACQRGYQVAFQELIGEKYRFSDGAYKAYNPHHMVFNATVMKSFLQTIKKRHNAVHWSTPMMEASCKTLDNCTCGFSEYGSYASWIKNSNPAVFAEIATQYRVQCKTKTCPTNLDTPDRKSVV